MECFKRSNAVDGIVKCALVKEDVNKVSEIAKTSMPFPYSKAVFYDCLKDPYRG